jgi:16S rRNA (uracil1498-N3)-methyltransferase
MHRYFSPSENISQDKIVISDLEQVHHIKNVLWLASGEKVAVFDDRQNEYACVVEEISAKKVVFSIVRRIPRKSRKGVSLTVACAIPKQCKLDDIIDKLTQLGVDRVIPLETERVIVRLDAKGKAAKLERWRKIALSAAKQSQRNDVPVIEPVKNMREALADAKNCGLKLIGSLFGEREPLRAALNRYRGGEVILFIGPEGDFSEAEFALARKHGFTGVSLGDLVLRVDTAAIAAAGFISLFSFDGVPADADD